MELMVKKSETSPNEKLTFMVEKWAVRDGHHVKEVFDPHGVKSLRHIRENRYPPQIWAVLFKERAHLRCRAHSVLESTMTITKRL